MKGLTKALSANGNAECDDPQNDESTGQDQVNDRNFNIAIEDKETHPK
jgi:hypothetical protein